MKTNTAVLLRFLLPPLYAALIIASVTFATAIIEGHPPDIGDYFLGIFVFILCSYLAASLPALLFAILLGRFARRRPAFGGRLTRATLLGLAAGLLLTAMIGIHGIEAAIVLLPLGTAVGFLVEATVVLLERRHVAAA